MRVLLDTHIALWAATGAPRLSSAARDLIADPLHELYVSVVSLWEVGIKASIGKFPINATQAEDLFRRCGYRIQDLSPSHARALDALAIRDDHRDPFDRMLVAQAIAEGALLVTGDVKLAPYSFANVKVC